MKQVLITTCGVVLTACSAYSDVKPKADVHLRVTDELPKPRIFNKGYSGVFSVTNTGEVAFTIVTDKEWSAETTRFYQEGTEEEQRAFENTHGMGSQLKEKERREVRGNYEFGIREYPETAKTLQPGESISFRCENFFILPAFGAPAGFYKAEMYLGHDTWVPVHIAPTLGTLYAIKHDSREPAGDFYYSQEGTNQYLYVKVDDKFKRVGEMKLKSTPRKEGKENTVTFETPDGETKKLTRDQAREVVREREQQNQ